MKSRPHLRSILVPCFVLVLIVFLPASSFGRTLENGSYGWDDVYPLQKRLIELGYLDEGQADAEYGNRTEAAVKAFQKANGLEATGIADETTQEKMYERTVVYAAGTTPVPTASPTLAPILEMGYVVSEDGLIAVEYNPNVESKIDNYCALTLNIVSVQSNDDEMVLYNISIEDLLLYANDVDEKEELLACINNCKVLTGGVYLISIDCSIGDATKTYQKVFLANNYFPEDIENADIAVINRCETILRNSLKNPYSLIMRSVTATNYLERDAVLYEIEYSGQNSLGGYTVDTVIYVYSITNDSIYSYSYASWMNEQYLDDETARVYTYTY